MFWASAIDVSLHPFWSLLLYRVCGGLVSECHQRHLVVVDVQRPVKPVSVVVLDIGIRAVIAPHITLDTLVELLRFAIGLRMAWS